MTVYMFPILEVYSLSVWYGGSPVNLLSPSHTVQTLPLSHSLRSMRVNEYLT